VAVGNEGERARKCCHLSDKIESFSSWIFNGGGGWKRKKTKSVVMFLENRKEEKTTVTPLSGRASKKKITQGPYAFSHTEKGGSDIGASLKHSSIQRRDEKGRQLRGDRKEIDLGYALQDSFLGVGEGEKGVKRGCSPFPLEK